MAQKKKQKKRTRSSVKASSRAKARGGKKTSKRRAPARKRRVRSAADVLQTRGVEIVSMSAVRPKARTARVGGGASDYVGVSPVQGAESESPRELLEEGQTFESEAVSGVQNAPNADRSEVKTHETPVDDVPQEYLDPDRP
jgi:hypothetical protein